MDQLLECFGGGVTCGEYPAADRDVIALLDEREERLGQVVAAGDAGVGACLAGLRSHCVTQIQALDMGVVLGAQGDPHQACATAGIQDTKITPASLGGHGSEVELKRQVPSHVLWSDVLFEPNVSIIGIRPLGIERLQTIGLAVEG